MTVASPTRMTVPDFLAWSETWAEGERWELAEGVPVRRARRPGRHAPVKSDLAAELARAVAAAGVEATVWPAGMTVPVGPRSAFVPDAAVQTGPRPDPDSVTLPRPVIVAEALAAGPVDLDVGRRLPAWFDLPSLRQLLVADASAKVLAVHSRRGDGRIDTAILREGEARLDPPGIALSVAALFARV